MKRIIALFFVISTFTFASSCTKESNVRPVEKAQKTITADKTDVGQGD